MVMKKTQRKELLRSIRKTGVSFFAVAFIAATSIAIFLGFRATAYALYLGADANFEEQELESLEVTCANGITQEDIQALLDHEDIDTAEGGYTCVVQAAGEDENLLVQARSYGQELNLPVVVEGTLPKGAGEAAVEEIYAEEKGIQVGDKLSLKHDGELYEDTFQVTAIVNDPVYCYRVVHDSRGKGEAGTGVASYYISLAKEAFDASYFDDCYTAAYIKSDSLRGIFSYSGEYEEKEAQLKEKIEELGKERSKLRYDSLMDEADEKISDGEQELADAKKEYQDGKKEISSKQKELDEAGDQIEASLALMGVSMDQALEQPDLLPEPLRSALEEYSEGRDALADAREELQTAEEDIAEAEDTLADAKSKVDEIEQRDWIVLSRDNIGDLRSVESAVSTIHGLSYSLALIFLIVAVVVCYAAINRLIDEQRVLIGAQKALGFTRSEIMRHYMFYNILCALLGTAIGFVGSVVIVEILVLHIHAQNFVITGFHLAFVWKEAAVVMVICLVIFMAATYIACARLIKMPATVLLRGEAPVKGKRYFFEKFRWYKRLSLYARTMVKNLLSDKGRMMTTIMGIVGCVSLLVVCLSIKLAIVDAPEKQFDKYFSYDNRLIVDSASGSAEEYEKVLEEEGVSYTRIQDKLKNIRKDEKDNWDNAHFVTAEDTGAFEGYMRLEGIKDKKDLELPDDGLLVSRRLAEIYGLEEGSAIEVMDEKGNPVTFEVSAVIEHYLPYHLLAAKDSYYEEKMGESADKCVFLLKGGEELVDRVKDMDGFLTLCDNSEYFESAIADSMDVVIAVCLALSAVMSVLVLLNQIVMHINRKKRELSVMRINGYTLKETKAYVYKDNIVLTVLGLLLGSGFGAGLSYVVILFIETDMDRYVRSPNLTACLCASAAEAVFALIVNIIALRKVSQLSFTHVSS